MPDYDDAWHDEWYRGMEASGGNIIAAMRMRVVEQSDTRVILSMAMSGGVRQGTGVFAAGALMQLADVAATMVCQRAAGSTPEHPKPFPLSVQISVNLLRNVNHGSVFAESTAVHRGARSPSSSRACEMKTAACCASSPAPTSPRAGDDCRIGRLHECAPGNGTGQY